MKCLSKIHKGSNQAPNVRWFSGQFEKTAGDQAESVESGLRGIC